MRRAGQVAGTGVNRAAQTLSRAGSCNKPIRALVRCYSMQVLHLGAAALVQRRAALTFSMSLSDSLQNQSHMHCLIHCSAGVYVCFSPVSMTCHVTTMWSIASGCLSARRGAAARGVEAVQVVLQHAGASWARPAPCLRPPACLQQPLQTKEGAALQQVSGRAGSVAKRSSKRAQLSLRWDDAGVIRTPPRAARHFSRRSRAQQAPAALSCF